MVYTRELLAEAVANSTTMAGVLRFLQLRPAGGTHAHVRRRISDFGIDTSHFTGKADLRDRALRAHSPAEVLVRRDPFRKRAPGRLLAAALMATGVPSACHECGIGPEWNGKPLGLQVDHINGDYADCRPENLRFLCPNCHTQTNNFAGRGKRKPADPITGAPRRTDTVAHAAQLLGCSTAHFYRLQRRFAANDPMDQQPGVGDEKQRRWGQIIRCGLAFPDLGPRKIALLLSRPKFGGVTVSHGTVSNVLGAAGLNTAAARHAAASPSTDAVAT